jgi:hypothetical protein
MTFPFLRSLFMVAPGSRLRVLRLLVLWLSQQKFFVMRLALEHAFAAPALTPGRPVVQGPESCVIYLLVLWLSQQKLFVMRVALEHAFAAPALTPGRPVVFRSQFVVV